MKRYIFNMNMNQATPQAIRIAGTLALTAALLTLVSCNFRENKSGLHWFLDMHDSHAVEAQEEDYTTLRNARSGKKWNRGADASPSFGGPGSGMRVPPAGAVPRGYTPYLYTDSVAAGRELKNPLKASKEVLKRGQDRYNIYCALCHGNTGLGDGSVVPRFPIPVPALAGKNANIASWPDGRVYHLITAGRGAMKSYAAQISPRDRWAIIHYLRLLHRAKK